MKQHTAAVDSLAQQLIAIEEWSSESGITLVSGVIQESKNATAVHWRADDPASWRGFLAQAKTLGASFVVLRESRMTPEDLESALGDAREHDNAERVKDLAECDHHVGHIWGIDLRWLAPSHPGVVFVWVYLTPWSDAVFGGEEEEKEGGAPGESDQRLSEPEKSKLAAKVAADAEFQRVPLGDGGLEVARRLVPPKIADLDNWDLHRIAREAREIADKELGRSSQVKQLADALARDAGFQRAKKQAQRVYAAEKFLPPDVVEHRPKFEIILEKATTIYEVDLRPGRSPRH